MSPRPWKLCAALLYLVLAAVGLARANAPMALDHQGSGGGSAQVCLDGIATPAHASLAFAGSISGEDLGDSSGDGSASLARMASVQHCAIAQPQMNALACRASVWRYGSSGGPRAP